MSEQAGHWRHTGNGGCVLQLGKCKAFVYAPSLPDGRWVWHTFDRCGIGGENADSPTRSEAMRDAFGSMLMQGWADPWRWQIGRPTRAWPRLPPATQSTHSRPEATRYYMAPHDIVRKLVQAFWLYGHYPVDSRGPAGLFMDVIKALRPDVAEVIRDEDISAAWHKFFEEDDPI